MFLIRFRFLGFFTNSGQVFNLISSFSSNKGLCVVPDGKSSQETAAYAKALQTWSELLTYILQNAK